ncbi:MAG: 3-deoxy-manno-octulosonate cytidylyltransferase, partial [Flavobacteriaceae bacterium]
RKEFLLHYVNMEQSPLEKIEKLEQLRALENGFKIKMIETDSSLMGIDTREDYEEALKKY